MRPSLLLRPRVGKLTVPYFVDSRQPVDFKALDLRRVLRCGKEGRCGVCGGKIRSGPIAFIGPDDGRDCFADPWMHLDCAQLAMVQCPFLSSHRGWRNRDDSASSRTAIYEHNMALYTATSWRWFRDRTGAHHFHATLGLQRIAP